MSRSTRHIAARIAALVLAALIAAPAVVVAAPPARSGPFVRAAGATAPKVHSRGRINPAVEARKPHKARPQVSRPRLAAGRPTGTAPRVATTAPRVAIPARTTLNPPIAQPPLAPPPLAGFSSGGPFTNLEPADPWVAVGPDHVVQMVNLAVRFQRRQGEIVSADLPTAAFFQLPPPVMGIDSGNSDGRIIYDSLHGRWLATEVSWDCRPFNDADGVAAFGRGYLDFAISDNADPTQPWTNYYLTFDDALPDYPAMGTSTDKVAFTSNIFPFTSPACLADPVPLVQSGVEIDVVDWTRLISSVVTGDVVKFSGPNDPILGTFDTPRAAVQVPATSPNVFGVIQMADGTDWEVGYFTLTGTVTGGDVLLNGPTNITNTLGSQKFGTPPSPRQQSATNPTLLNAVDGRPTDAIWQAGRLVFVATTNCTPVGDIAERDCVRVAELDTAVPTLRQDFLLSEVGKDYYHGGIGLSLNGSLHVTYSRSSPANFIEGFAVYQLLTDPLNAVSIAENVLPATNEYAPGERWGDYLGVAQDPQAPGAVWRTNQAAAVGGGWTTNVGQLNTDAGSTYTAITPIRVLDTRISLGLVGRFQSNIARTFRITDLTGPLFGIPANAVAITGNVTPVSQTAVGYVAVTPRPTNKPTSATVNFPLNDARNNNVTTLLGPGGQVSATYVAAAGKFTHLVFDVTGYFTAGGAAATYRTVTPARILDTRPAPNNVQLQGRFQRGVPRRFQVRGFGPVPNNPAVVAVTGNLTVTGQNSAGDIALGPVSPADPFNPGTSNLNYIRGDNRGNGVSARLGSGGELWAVVHSSTAGASADLVFDVTGYYTSDATGFRYFALNPGRIMDTRPSNPLSVVHGSFGGSPTVTTPPTKAVDTGGRQGVPLTAKAVTGNLAATAPSKAGHIEIMVLTTDPPTSSLNFPAGDTRSNGITVPLRLADGDLLMHYHTSGGGTVHLILDITGYFK